MQTRIPLTLPDMINNLLILQDSVIMKYLSLKCDIHAGCCVDANMNILNIGLFVLARSIRVVPDGAASEAMMPEYGTINPKSRCSSVNGVLYS